MEIEETQASWMLGKVAWMVWGSQISSNPSLCARWPMCDLLHTLTYKYLETFKVTWTGKKLAGKGTYIFILREKG